MLADDKLESQILSGRSAVGVYRYQHGLLHASGWYADIHTDHTPLLKVLVDALDQQGFTSIETGFEPKKTEVLARFWDASDLLNIQKLGFADKEDFEAKANDSDRKALEELWR